MLWNRAGPWPTSAYVDYCAGIAQCSTLPYLPRIPRPILQHMRFQTLLCACSVDESANVALQHTARIYSCESSTTSSSKDKECDIEIRRGCAYGHAARSAKARTTPPRCQGSRECRQQIQCASPLHQGSASGFQLAGGESRSVNNYNRSWN